MPKEIKKIIGGLLPLPKDKRDFKLGQIWKPIPIEEVPKEDFVIAEPIKIEDQGMTDFCTGYAASAVSEDQEMVDLDPLYAYAKIKQLSGDWQSWGADLRTACKAMVKFGCIEKKDSPYTLEKGRDFLANWENWPENLDQKALLHRKGSFFMIDDSPYDDLFDAMRAALWQHRNERCSILTGTLWENEWTYAKDGIIPEKEGNVLMGHAFKIFGQKIIDGEIYLVAQLSNGTDIGDKGLFYFSRKVVNRKFKPFGAFMFKDLSPEEAKKYCWPLWRRIWEKIKKVIKEILEKIKSCLKI